MHRTKDDRHIENVCKYIMAAFHHYMLMTAAHDHRTETTMNDPRQMHRKMENLLCWRMRHLWHQWLYLNIFGVH